MAKLWRKTTIRWTLNGNRAPAGTPGAIRRVEKSARFYGTLRLADGRSKQMPLCEDRDASRKLLRRLQTEEDTVRATGVDHRVRHRPLTDLIVEYERDLRSKGCTTYHIDRTVQCIRAIVVATKAERSCDLDAGKTAHVLSEWRKTGRPIKRNRKPSPLSISRTNVYTRAVKGFSRWLITQGAVPTDPLVSLRCLNAATDLRHVRRSLTTAELGNLIKATQASKVTVKRGDGRLTGMDRSMLYLVANAGITYRDDQDRVVDFHALRHTFVSALARSGVHPAEAQRLARHSTIDLTMNVYTHVEQDRLRLSVNQLPSIGVAEDTP